MCKAFHCTVLYITLSCVVLCALYSIEYIFCLATFENYAPGSLTPYLPCTHTQTHTCPQSTAFQNQGCQMDLQLGSLMIPVSGLALFDTIAILTLLPIFDGYVYPYFKTKGRSGLTMLDKIGLGFVCMIMAMAVAGLVEMLRQSEKATAGDYTDEAARDNISPCQNLDDYNPFQYQQWDAGEVSYKGRVVSILRGLCIVSV